MRRLVAAALLCPVLFIHAEEKETALGRKLSRDFERKSTLAAPSDMSEYAAKLGQRLRSGIAPVKVISDERARAIAFPGGFVYVSTGLIARTDSEAELAGVLAHAIAHTDNLPQPAARQTPIILFPCALWPDTAKFLVPRPLGIERESDANVRGLEIARAAGFDPLGLIEFLTRWRYDFPPAAEYLPIEPLLALRTRIEDTQAPSPEYVVTSNAFLNAKRSAEEHIHAHVRTPDAPSLQKRKP